MRVCVCVCVCFVWLYRAACRIVVSQAGIEPTLPAMEALSSKNWTTRELPRLQSMGSQRVGHDLVTDQQQPLSKC